MRIQFDLHIWMEAGLSCDEGVVCDVSVLEDSHGAQTYMASLLNEPIN